jgi:heptosyltransferase I
MNILIVKTSAIGDIVQSFTILEYLKEKFPHAQIDWVVSKNNSSLVSSHPLIRKAIYFDLKTGLIFKSIKNLRSSFYDVVFDLQGNSKSGLITLLARGKNKVGFGWKSISEWPNLLSTNFQYDISKKINIRVQYLKLIQSYFLDKSTFPLKKIILKINDEEKAQIDLILNNKIFQSGKLDKKTNILIAPCSKWKNKEIPLSILIDFMNLINKHLGVIFILAWGDQNERSICLKIAQNFENSFILDKLSLPVLQNLIKELDLVIAMDSSILHLSGSVNTPSFSFFGPTAPEVYKPIGNKHFAFQGKCDFQKTFLGRCPHLRTCQKPSCIKEFEAEKIFNLFINWWNSIK